MTPEIKKLLFLLSDELSTVKWPVTNVTNNYMNYMSLLLADVRRFRLGLTFNLVRLMEGKSLIIDKFLTVDQDDRALALLPPRVAA